MPTATKKRQSKAEPMTPAVRARICMELQALQRMRVIAMKSRIMSANRLQAIIAGTLGYSSGMAEKDRQKKFKEASDLIKAVMKGEAHTPMESIIRATMIGIEALEAEQARHEKAMLELVKKLPVAAWVEKPEQRGFGLMGLAIIVGECGDLCNYSGPGRAGIYKLWRRMCLNPWTFDGKTAMGATWRSGREGKLPAEQWEQFGYSPRRRSIAYNIADPLLKLNGRCEAGEGNYDDVTAAGPYRLEYESAKASVAKSHPDYKPMRCHLHGMLLMTKLLLANLWREWKRTAK